MAAILIVEDVSVVRMTIRKILERAGHTIVECEEGEAAWAQFSSQPFDVLITDMRMKGGDGVDLIQRIRRQGSAMPVLAITAGDPGLDRMQLQAMALRAGANRALLKPIPKDTLVGAVADLLETQGRAQNVA